MGKLLAIPPKAYDYERVESIRFGPQYRVSKDGDGFVAYVFTTEDAEHLRNALNAWDAICHPPVEQP